MVLLDGLTKAIIGSSQIHRCFSDPNPQRGPPSPESFLLHRSPPSGAVLVLESQLLGRVIRTNALAIHHESHLGRLEGSGAKGLRSHPKVRPKERGRHRGFHAALEGKESKEGEAAKLSFEVGIEEARDTSPQRMTE